MIDLIDFSLCPKTPKAYSGANGSKISVIHDGDVYMLKFHGLAKNNPRMTYSNSVTSEYIGSKVFASVGIEAQEVLLGTYAVEGSGPAPVVACKDFASDGFVLQDFAAIKNTVVETTQSGYGVELDEILQAMRSQSVMDAATLEERFWETFVIDALIGNWDRHNGNWGMLYNQQTSEVKMAPVFDCGSCLFPQADPSIMQMTLTDRRALDVRTYDIPLSAFKIDGAKQTYHRLLATRSDEGLHEALAEIYPRIDIAQISKIIDDVPDPMMDPLHKAFTKEVLASRYDNLITPAYERACFAKERNRRLSPARQPSLREAGRRAQRVALSSDDGTCCIYYSHQR